MPEFLCLVLIVLVGLPLAIAQGAPQRIYEYPFFMAFAFAAFILPQAFSLSRFPGSVEDASVTAILLMSCLCMSACLIGYQLAPSALVLRWTSRRVDSDRMFVAGAVFVATGYAMHLALGRINATFVSGRMTGTGTLIYFFRELAYPGFAIALFSSLRQPRFATIVTSLLGLVVPLADAINGRRENTTILLLTVALALFYERGVRPSRLVMAMLLTISALAIPATGEYRRYASTGDWSGVFGIDMVGNFTTFLTEESSLELRNGAAVIESTRLLGDYQLGKGYWNHLVARFVPAQLIGDDAKKFLMFDTWDILANNGTEAGATFIPGSTITGMGDTFSQFGWMGCLFFAFMAVVFKAIWQASLAPDALFGRLLYAMTITSGMRAVTHWTFDFLPGLLYFAIFLGLAALYAEAPTAGHLGGPDPQMRRLARRSLAMRHDGSPTTAFRCD